MFRYSFKRRVNMAYHRDKNMQLRKLNPDLEKIAREELGEDPSRVAECIKTIKEWLAKQPHITANEDDQWILIFLRGCKFSIERVKVKIDGYYSGRTSMPEYLIGCDPETEKFRKCLRTGCVVSPKELIALDGSAILIVKPGAIKVDEFNYPLFIKVEMMMIEVLQLENDNINIIGMSMLVDMEDMTMSHVASITPLFIRKAAKWADKGLPMRFKGLHYMNTPPGIEMVYTLTNKILTSSKLLKRIHIHSKKNTAEVFKYFPKKIIPKEYGGDGESVRELVDFWEAKFLKYRDYFIKAMNYRTDESKRPGRQTAANMEGGIQGSFRTLSLD